jgi:hypothetical protein
MRIFLSGLFILFLTSISWSQTCDIATGGMSANPSTPIHVGETVDFVFYVYNEAQGGDCCYEVESVLVYVAFPNNGGLTFQSVISPSGGTGPYFDWVYDATENTVIGINHTEICDAEGEVDVTIRMLASTLPFYPQNRTSIITLLNNPDGPPFLSNNEGNDNGIVTVQILAPLLPIDLSAFNASSESCDRVDIFWETAAEINNDYVEIQRSEDGKTFIPVGKVKGTNLSGSAATYNYTDKSVKGGTLYYYRLRQVDFDGKEELHHQIPVRTKDCNFTKSVDIHPNPVADLLNFGYTGFENDEVIQCVVTNAIGEIVKVSKNVPVSSLKQMDVSQLTSGIYNIKIESNNETYIHKFVKI